MTAPGYRLVPEEPTDEMCAAMIVRVKEAISGEGAPFEWPDLEHMYDIYRTAFAAAPQPEPPADLVEKAKALFIGLAENMRHERDGDGMWCGDSNSWVNIKIQAEKIAALAQEHAAAEKARADAAEKALVDEREAKNYAYAERNKLVAFLARLYPSGIKRTDIDGWDPAWHNCVYVDLPTGQASWHYHDSDAALFSDLPAYGAEWDGHSTPEKYERVARLAAIPARKGGGDE